MKLLLDLGNSRLKWGVWDGEVWQADGSRVLESETPKQIEEWLKPLPRPSEIWLASVGNASRADNVSQACGLAFGLPVTRARSTRELGGLRCAYAEPARLGVDRWLAIVAAYVELGGPVVVFDCGTALTVDAAGADGEHLGGLIMPGISLMRRALYSAPGIPDEGEGDVGLLARDTRSAVTGGTLYAAVAFVQHVAAELRGYLGEQTRLVLTGGDAERLSPLLQEHFEIRPQLVLDGLRIAAQEAQ